MSKRRRTPKIPVVQSIQRSVNIVRAEVAALERQQKGREKHPRSLRRKRRNLSPDALERLRPEVMVESR